jgi:hypothetical protein
MNSYLSEPPIYNCTEGCHIMVAVVMYHSSCHDLTALQSQVNQIVVRQFPLMLNTKRKREASSRALASKV